MTNLLTPGEIADMRQTVFDVTLDMVCVIERRVYQEDDPGGQPIYAWEPIASDEPCHYWKEMEIELIGTQNVVVSRERLVLLTTVVILTQDRISSLNDVDGIEVVAGVPLDVIEVVKQQNQTTLVLRQIKT